MIRYDPALPWGGRGSPCRDVSFPDLADCRECLMCGFCEVHDGCASDWNHISWHARFASPGEEACATAGRVGGRGGYACALPAGHGGEWHQERGGGGWPVAGAPVANIEEAA